MNAEEREEWLDQLIQTRTFDQLTPAERAFVLDELGNEAGYEALRKVDQQLRKAHVPEITAGPKVLASLQQRLNDQHRRTSWITAMMTIRMPAIPAALLIVVCSGIAWWLGSQRDASPVVLRTEVVRDTVWMAAVRDTVFVERIVYRTSGAVKTNDQAVFTMVRTEQQNVRVPVGVNMKEKEELNKLIVAGSW